MRTTAIVLGALLFVLGAAWAVTSSLTAFYRADDVSGTDWNCYADGTTGQRCTTGPGDADDVQAEVTAGVAQTIAGSTAAICGVLFIGIGARRPQPGPQPVPYGPPPVMGPPPGYRG